MVFTLKVVKENMHRGGVCIEDQLRHVFCLSPWLSCPHILLWPLWELAAGLTPALVHCTGAGSAMGSSSVQSSPQGLFHALPRMCSRPAGEPQAAPGWISSRHTPMDLHP